MPGPASTLTTPGGSAAANAAPNSSATSGQVGGTLITAVLPADSADVSFIISTASGQLNGRTSAATPYGSRCRRGYDDCGSICSGASAVSAIPPSSDARNAPAFDLEVRLGEHLAVLAGVQPPAVPAGQLFGGRGGRRPDGGNPLGYA